MFILAIVLSVLIKSTHACEFTAEFPQIIPSQNTSYASYKTSCSGIIQPNSAILNEDTVGKSTQFKQSFFCSSNPLRYNIELNRLRGLAHTLLDVTVYKKISWETSPQPFATILYTQQCGRETVQKTHVTFTSQIVPASPNPKILSIESDGNTKALFSIKGDPPPWGKNHSQITYENFEYAAQTHLNPRVTLPITDTFTLTFSLNSLRLHEALLCGGDVEQIIDLTRCFPHTKNTCDATQHKAPPIIMRSSYKLSFIEQYYVSDMSIEQNNPLCTYSVEYKRRELTCTNTHFTESHTVSVQANTHSIWLSQKIPLAHCTYTYTTPENGKKEGVLWIEGTISSCPRHTATYQITAKFSGNGALIDQFSLPTTGRASLQKYPEIEAQVTTSFEQDLLHNPEKSKATCSLKLLHTTINISTNMYGEVTVSKEPRFSYPLTPKKFIATFKYDEFFCGFSLEDGKSI